MKRERKIYDPAFKTKAVQLSNERANISEWPENWASNNVMVVQGLLLNSMLWLQNISDHGCKIYEGAGFEEQVEQKI